MKPSPSLRLHYGAAHDDIIIDNQTFIRHQLQKRQFMFLHNVLIDVLLKIGKIKRKKK